MSCILKRWFEKIVKCFDFVIKKVWVISSTESTFFVYHLNNIFWNNGILVYKLIFYCTSNLWCPLIFHTTRDFFSSHKIFQFYVLVSKAAILLLVDVFEKSILRSLVGRTVCAVPWRVEFCILSKDFPLEQHKHLQIGMIWTGFLLVPTLPHWHLLIWGYKLLSI